MMELAFALVLTIMTVLGWRWASRAAGAGDVWASLARAFPAGAALVWAYIATAVASAHTWRMGLPGPSELIAGGLLVAAGLGVLAAGAWTERSPAFLARRQSAAGAAVVLGGIALLGDSGFGLLLAAIFAGLTVLHGRAAASASNGALDAQSSPPVS